ncbi:hypothetical protein KY290_011047 [Solanum tuberosum]|uniref:Uncharacterized protein n=1 Tax=Solanum tuberosum TaxID=4113 RepID=A0ABQ7W1I8_SOLTU|nr:hypothetical protein KY290_011047 [Solanum tuberosum]
MKQGRASEEAALFCEMETTSVRAPSSPKVPRSYREAMSHLANWRSIDDSQSSLCEHDQITKLYRMLLRKCHNADLVGDSPSSLGDPDLARPLSFLDHFWASYDVID